jgi:hypothetical protein
MQISQVHSRDQPVRGFISEDAHIKEPDQAMVAEELEHTRGTNPPTK